MTGQPTFVLDGSTLLTIGGVIGALAGAITFLFRQLIASKDAQIAALIAEMRDQRAVMMEQIEALKTERNYFRDAVLRDRRAGRPEGGR